MSSSFLFLKYVNLKIVVGFIIKYIAVFLERLHYFTYNISKNGNIVMIMPYEKNVVIY